MYKKWIKNIFTACFLFGLYGCASIKSVNMEIIDDVIFIPKDNGFSHNIAMGSVKVNGDDFVSFSFKVDEKLFKQAIKNSLNSYFNNGLEDKPDYVINVEMLIEDFGFLDKRVTTNAVYSLINLQNGQKNKFNIKATYTAAFSGDMFFRVLLSGHYLKYMQPSALTREDQEKLVKVAYARPGTPLTSSDGGLRLMNAVAGGIRANIAGMIKMLASCKFSNSNEIGNIGSCNTINPSSKSIFAKDDKGQLDKEDESFSD